MSINPPSSDPTKVCFNGCFSFYDTGSNLSVNPPRGDNSQRRCYGGSSNPFFSFGSRFISSSWDIPGNLDIQTSGLLYPGFGGGISTALYETFGEDGNSQYPSLASAYPVPEFIGVGFVPIANSTFVSKMNVILPDQSYSANVSIVSKYSNGTLYTHQTNQVSGFYNNIQFSPSISLGSDSTFGIKVSDILKNGNTTQHNDRHNGVIQVTTTLK